MSQIFSAAGLALGPWARYGLSASSAMPDVGSGAGTTPASGLANDAALTESGLTSQDLLAMNAGVDDVTRTSNALSTAHSAISVIGGLLGNIQNVLTAADPANGQPFDPAAEQSRIDSAVSTIDAIASSAQFGGRNLLDGTFSLPEAGGPLSLPSFLSQTLGATPASGQDASSPPALASLMTGGSSDLASGNLAAAGQIVATALSQTTATQNQIDSYQADTLGLDPASIQFPLPGVCSSSSPIDAMYVTAFQMLGDPSMAALATANSSAQNVLTLIQP